MPGITEPSILALFTNFIYNDDKFYFESPMDTTINRKDSCIIALNLDSNWSKELTKEDNTFTMMPNNKFTFNFGQFEATIYISMCLYVPMEMYTASTDYGHRTKHTSMSFGSINVDNTETLIVVYGKDYETLIEDINYSISILQRRAIQAKALGLIAITGYDEGVEILISRSLPIPNVEIKIITKFIYEGIFYLTI